MFSWENLKAFLYRWKDLTFDQNKIIFNMSSWQRLMLQQKEKSLIIKCGKFSIEFRVKLLFSLEIQHVFNTFYLKYPGTWKSPPQIYLVVWVFLDLVELSRQWAGKASSPKQFGERMWFCPFSNRKNIWLTAGTGVRDLRRLSRKH